MNTSIWALVISPKTLNFPLESFSEHWKDNQGEICAYGKIEGDDYWFFMPGIGHYALDTQIMSVTAYPQRNTPESRIWDTYYRTVLPLFLQSQGAEILHASAVSTAQGVIAFCARSETGKSTLAFGLSKRGYPLWADDAVMFRVQEAVTAIQLPFSVRLRKPSADFYQYPDRDHRDLLTENSSIELQEKSFRGLFILERFASDNEKIVHIEAISPSTAFTTVLPHAYSFSLENQKRKTQMMQQYLSFVDKIPIFSLKFKPGLDHIKTILDDIEHSLSTLG